MPEDGVFTREIILCQIILMLKVVMVMSSFKILHDIQSGNLRKTTTDLTRNSNQQSVKICIQKKQYSCTVSEDTQSVVMIINGQSFDQLHDSLKYMSVWKGLWLWEQGEIILYYLYAVIIFEKSVNNEKYM